MTESIFLPLLFTLPVTLFLPLTKDLEAAKTSEIHLKHEGDASKSSMSNW